MKKVGEPDSNKPKLPRWPLLNEDVNGEAFHPLINTGETQSCTDGDWKLVVTYGKTINYALYNLREDPEEKKDLSDRLEQITFRLRGMLEQKEGLEYQAELRQ